MNIFKKHILPCAMAGVLAASLAIPAFAADPIAEATENEFEVEVTGEFYSPTIRVSVTSEGTLYVNPTGGIIAGTLKDALDTGSDVDYEYSNQKVASTPVVVRSDADYDLDVYVEASATASGKVKLVSALSGTAGSRTGTGNEMVLSIAGTTSDDDSGYASAVTEAAFTENSTAIAPVATDSTGKTAALASTKITTVENRAAAASSSQYVLLAVTGTINDEVEWTEDDLVDVNLILTFAQAAASN